jgi:hypothetical protein
LKAIDQEPSHIKTQSKKSWDPRNPGSDSSEAELMTDKGYPGITDREHTLSGALSSP